MRLRGKETEREIAGKETEEETNRGVPVPVTRRGGGGRGEERTYAYLHKVQ
jgi:hypothetical protein